MGMIPTADGLGGRTYQPVDMPKVVRGAAGVQGIQDIGDQVGALGQTMLIEQQQVAKEQAAARLAADKAQALATIADAQDQFAAAHDEIGNGVLTGQVDKTKAREVWTQRAQELQTSILANAPESQKATISLDMQRLQGKLGRSLDGIVAKRDRQDVTAGMQQTLEYASRLYASDPAAASQMAKQTLEGLGPNSDLAPDQLQKLGQTWRENAVYTSAFTALNGARDSYKGLGAFESSLNTDAYADLDPQKKAQLLNTAAGYKARLEQKAEMAAQRAERERERYLKQAEAEFNVFQTMADKGTQLDPDYVARVSASTAGTPYQAGVKALAAQAVATGGLAAQPIASQQATLDAVNAEIAQHGRSPELDKRASQIEKVLRGSQQDLDKDGLRAGLERGIIDQIKPLDFSNGIPGALAGLGERLVQAQRISTWAGRQVSPLTDDEATKVKSMLDPLPPKERSVLISQVAAAMGPDAAAGLSRQMDPKDKALGLAIGMAGSTTTNGRLVSELVLKGQQAQRDGTSTKNEKQADVKPAQWTRAVATQLDGLFPSQTLTDGTRDAAVLIAHGLAAEQGGALSNDDLDRAVRLAVGGSLVDHNGRKIVLPAGVDDDALQKRLRSVSADEIKAQSKSASVRAAGVSVPAETFVNSLPGAQLVYAGPGRFNVLVGGRPVTSEDGRRRITIGVQ